MNEHGCLRGRSTRSGREAFGSIQIGVATHSEDRTLHANVNLGILAHVDAGKTSLPERLLYAATRQTDSLALERHRGITIKSAVVSFVVDDVAVNLITRQATRTSSSRWSGC